MDIEKQVKEAEYRIHVLRINHNHESADVMQNLVSIISQQGIMIHQLRGALGYPVPGNIKDNPDIINGLADAKEKELSQQSAEIERLKRINEIAIDALNNISGHYMDYIENNIECDTAATRMDNTVDNALAVIGALTPVGGESPC